jgi:hypothetical protein
MTAVRSVHVAWGVLLLLPMHAGAQVTPTARSDSVQTIVVADKSAFAAGALEWMIPTVGYAYAGNWSRGILPGLVRISGMGLLFSHLSLMWLEDAPCRGRCVAGCVMGLGGAVWAVVDAANTAKRENRRRRAAAGVSIVPTVDHNGLGAAILVAIHD